MPTGGWRSTPSARTPSRRPGHVMYVPIDQTTSSEVFSAERGTRVEQRNPLHSPSRQLAPARGIHPSRMQSESPVQFGSGCTSSRGRSPPVSILWWTEQATALQGANVIPMAVVFGQIAVASIRVLSLSLSLLSLLSLSLSLFFFFFFFFSLALVLAARIFGRGFRAGSWVGIVASRSNFWRIQRRSRRIKDSKALDTYRVQRPFVLDFDGAAAIRAPRVRTIRTSPRSV